MGQSESRTITQGEIPPQLLQQHILRRNDISERPFLAPQFAPYTPKTLYKVRCPFSINLKSISLIPRANEASEYAISFSGRCLQPFSISIYTFAREIVGDDLLTRDIVPLTPGKIVPAPCVINESSEFSFNGWDHDMGIVTTNQINSQSINMQDSWSAIIQLGLDTLSQEPSIVHSLLGYCVMRMVSGIPKIMIIAQKCLIQNHGFFITEMYGLGDLSKAESESKECVICMTNERNTCVLPCRHICCCAECANTLRLQTDRCPVCRELMTELVYLTVNPDYLGASQDESGHQNIEMNNL